MASYYLDKLESLRDIFGTPEVTVDAASLRVAGHEYPIVDDVIILLDPSRYTAFLNQQLRPTDYRVPSSTPSASIQFTFGKEWEQFGEVLPAHGEEFQRYFDIVDLSGLIDYRVCDLGCGSGRWSVFLSPHCKELVLIDFSDAIFVARRNLTQNRNALFFMGDLTKLPFRKDFADFLYCLGVLHHLPTPALDEVRTLAKYAPTLLVYLYYALDNRPAYFRVLLRAVTACRRLTARMRNRVLRNVITLSGSVAIYAPLILLGHALRPLGLSGKVPLYETYHAKPFRRIQQDVYDRFFTAIEQRHTRAEILTLADAFSSVTISEGLPYWHFLCRR